MGAASRNSLTHSTIRWNNLFSENLDVFVGLFLWIPTFLNCLDICFDWLKESRLLLRFCTPFWIHRSSTFMPIFRRSISGAVKEYFWLKFTLLIINIVVVGIWIVEWWPVLGFWLLQRIIMKYLKEFTILLHIVTVFWTLSYKLDFIIFPAAVDSWWDVFKLWSKRILVDTFGYFQVVEICPKSNTGSQSIFALPFYHGRRFLKLYFSIINLYALPPI